MGWMGTQDLNHSNWEAANLMSSQISCWMALDLDLNMEYQGTAVQLVFNPLSQLVPQLELYSHLQLSLWSDPIAFSVPKPTY